MTLTRTPNLSRIAEKGTTTSSTTLEEEEEVDEPTMPASDGEDEDPPNDDDDASSSSEDENAHLKRFKPSNINNSNTKVLPIPRNDSLSSFLTRSERAAAFGKDPPPSPDEARKRRVQFVDALEHVHEIEDIPAEVRSSVYMSQADFDRAETEMKMTLFRWENHTKGHIPFDENTNSIRGLEHLWDRPAQTKRSLVQYKHSRAVLEEINRQKHDHQGQVRDWEMVRKISQQFSVHSHNEAVEVGRQDRDAHERAWNNNNDGNYHTFRASGSTSTQVEVPKKKLALKLRFWQKKK